MTQPDHAALAGELAQRWGNDRFAPPARGRSLVAAAARHDDGWATIDGRPAVLALEGRPAHFLEVELTDTVGPYGEGVEGIYADDRYAGVLATRHWTGLFSSRWGLGDNPPSDHPAAQAVVTAQEQRAAAEARALWGGQGRRSAFEAGLWHDYEILQALDLISLALCLIDLGRPSDPGAAALPVPATLRELEQPPGARIVPEVPLGGVVYAEVTLTVVGDGVVSADPYPFDEPEVPARIRLRTIDDVRHERPQDAARAYHDAGPVQRPVTIVASGG